MLVTLVMMRIRTRQDCSDWIETRCEPYICLLFLTFFLAGCADEEDEDEEMEEAGEKGGRSTGAGQGGKRRSRRSSARKVSYRESEWCVCVCVCVCVLLCI